MSGERAADGCDEVLALTAAAGGLEHLELLFPVHRVRRDVDDQAAVRIDRAFAFRDDQRIVAGNLHECPPVRKRLDDHRAREGDTQHLSVGGIRVRGVPAGEMDCEPIQASVRVGEGRRRAESL